MDGNGGKSLFFTKMSPGLDNWRLEAQCSSTHSKSMQPYRPYRSAMDPRTIPKENFGRTTSLFVGAKRVEGREKETEKENVVVAEVDESSTSNKMKVVNAFKFVLIEHIRGVLKPFWKQGNLSRDAYKIILKKSVDKILESIEASKFPKNKSDHQKYLSASKSKIFELVQAYVKKYQKIASILKSACLALRLGLQDPR
ncbi:zinc finger CCCH domain-containing protein 55-like [Primulina eburnea]|uniref:zinc finger CCCH domain-containing protein 55-like n=1 Tax=Primulina eburnea TaxID=1245227 RepID=UPI003C6C2A0B